MHPARQHADPGTSLASAERGDRAQRAREDRLRAAAVSRAVCPLLPHPALHDVVARMTEHATWRRRFALVATVATRVAREGRAKRRAATGFIDESFQPDACDGWTTYPTAVRVRPSKLFGAGGRLRTPQLRVAGLCIAWRLPTRRGHPWSGARDEHDPHVQWAVSMRELDFVDPMDDDEHDSARALAYFPSLGWKKGDSAVRLVAFLGTAACTCRRAACLVCGRDAERMDATLANLRGVAGWERIPGAEAAAMRHDEMMERARKEYAWLFD